MKFLLTAFGAASVALLMPVTAQVTETKTKKQVTESADGSVQKSSTTQTTTTFNPQVQTQVTEYFDAYKTSPHGLPPAWVTKMKVKEIPAAWRTTRIAPGVMVTEKERPYLVEAPPELVKVLPASTTSEVRYYVAGSNVVAVDKSFKVVDSIQIPSIQFKVE